MNTAPSAWMGGENCVAETGELFYNIAAKVLSVGAVFTR